MSKQTKNLHYLIYAPCIRDFWVKGGGIKMDGCSGRSLDKKGDLRRRRLLLKNSVAGAVVEISTVSRRFCSKKFIHSFIL